MYSQDWGPYNVIPKHTRLQRVYLPQPEPEIEVEVVIEIAPKVEYADKATQTDPIPETACQRWLKILKMTKGGSFWLNKLLQDAKASLRESRAQRAAIRTRSCELLKKSVTPSSSSTQSYKSSSKRKQCTKKELKSCPGTPCGIDVTLHDCADYRSRRTKIAKIKPVINEPSPIYRRNRHDDLSSSEGSVCNWKKLKSAACQTTDRLTRKNCSYSSTRLNCSTPRQNVCKPECDLSETSLSHISSRNDLRCQDSEFKKNVYSSRITRSSKPHFLRSPTHMEATDCYDILQSETPSFCSQTSCSSAQQCYLPKSLKPEEMSRYTGNYSRNKSPVNDSTTNLPTSLNPQSLYPQKEPYSHCETAPFYKRNEGSITKNPPSTFSLGDRTVEGNKTSSTLDKPFKINQYSRYSQGDRTVGRNPTSTILDKTFKVNQQSRYTQGDRTVGGNPTSTTFDKTFKVNKQSRYTQDDRIVGGEPTSATLNKPFTVNQHSRYTQGDRTVGGNPTSTLLEKSFKANQQSGYSQSERSTTSSSQYQSAYCRAERETHPLERPPVGRSSRLNDQINVSSAHRNPSRSPSSSGHSIAPRIRGNTGYSSWTKEK